MNARLLFVHALSPLHAGTGQGVGVIDLPIAREKATNLPYLPGSSLKGTLRDTPSPHIGEDLRVKMFGPDGTNVKADEYAGSVLFSDQRLLLLPVRSLVGTFAWITSPFVLRRLQRDARSAQVKNVPAAIPQPSSTENCVAATGSVIATDNKIYLEDLDLQADSAPAGQQPANQWGAWIARQLFPATNAKSPDAAESAEWQQILISRFCVVHDDVFSFLLDTATEITARIKLLDDTKTVQEGALWYEEALPTETVLYGLVVATPVRRFKDVIDDAKIFNALAALAAHPLQFGGKATVGRGLCRMQMQL